MRNIAAWLLALVLVVLIFSPAHAADLIVQFKDAVATLTQEPCTMNGADPSSPLKNGSVKFTDERPSRKLCWLEEDGLIWVIDEAITVFSFSSDNAKPAGVDI